MVFWYMLQNVTADSHIVTQVDQTSTIRWVFVWDVRIEPASPFSAYAPSKKTWEGDAIRPLLAHSLSHTAITSWTSYKATVGW